MRFLASHIKHEILPMLHSNHPCSKTPRRPRATHAAPSSPAASGAASTSFCVGAPCTCARPARQPRTCTAPPCQLSPRRQLLAKTASRRLLSNYETLRFGICLFARIAAQERGAPMQGGRAGLGVHLALLDGVRGRRAPPVLDRGGRHLRGSEESGAGTHVTEFDRMSDCGGGASV